MCAANYWHCVKISLQRCAIKEFVANAPKMGKVRLYSKADSHNKSMLVVVKSNEKGINICVQSEIMKKTMQTVKLGAITECKNKFKKRLVFGI